MNSRLGFEPYREPIAIVGMACRFPGAETPQALWQLLTSGTDAISAPPADRAGLWTYPEAAPGAPGRVATRDGGFLSGLDQFDAAFFGISPREAVYLDPQQRLLLELAWEAFEDAGIVPRAIAGSSTGVFVGMWANDYEDAVYRATDDVDLYVTTGSGRYAASARLSYAFDLRGPSLTIDTACSSSLVAVHLACRSIWSNETDAALAAGVNVILEPHVSIGYSRSRMLSPRARCRFGDASADGYVRSEGAGLVVLKRLSHALAGGDRIHALIRSTAVNNDGRSAHFVAPSVDGQEAMLRRAYLDAGISPGSVQYIEAHGTGTAVGDPVELEALARLLNDRPFSDRRCAIGSVKTNIGHTEAASGMAGLIKTVLAMQHEEIPPSLHLVEPNPAIPWDTLPFEPVRSSRSWPASHAPRVAGVNSFGITGTNAHVVLQDYVDARAAWPPDSSRPQVLLLSAQTQFALRSLAATYSTFLQEQQGDGFQDVCRTAVRRTHHERRLAVTAATADEAADAIDAYLLDEMRAGVEAGQIGDTGATEVVFVFPGQGSQWPGMGRALLATEPVFLDAMRQCDTIVRQLTDRSVLDAITVDADPSPLLAIDVVQPALFSVQVSLAALWRSWGVEPAAVVGHSMGEIAAAHVAGALSLEDAVTIVCRRSALMRRLSGRGAMAVVDLPRHEAEAAIRPWADRLSVAVANSPRSTVLSGDADALDAVLAMLEERGAFCRKAKVDVASHSSQVNPLRDDLLGALAALKPAQCPVPFHSTVTGERVEGDTLTADYWWRNLREPVLFAPTVASLIRCGYRTFIEMSPHPLLLDAIETIGQEAGTACVAVPSGRRDETDCRVILSSAAALHCRGALLRWERILGAPRRVVSLPPYPWQRERFWYESKARTPAVRRLGAGGTLGEPFRPAQQAGTSYWELELGLETMPWLADHRVRGSIVVPAALYVALMMTAARAAFDADTNRLTAVGVGAALVVPDDRMRRVQVVAMSDGSGGGTLRVLSSDGTDGRGERHWVEHASATARGASGNRDLCDPPARIAERCAGHLDAAAFYATLRHRALDYGPSLQTVGEVSVGSGEMLGGLVTRSLAPDKNFEAWAQWLDGCVQLLAAAAPGQTDTYVPVRFDEICIWSEAPAAEGETWCRVAWNATQDEGRFRGQIDVIDDSGMALTIIRGCHLQLLAAEGGEEVQDLLYHLAWEPAAADQFQHQPAGAWAIVTRCEERATALVGELKSRGSDVVVVRDDQADLDLAVQARHVAWLAGADMADAAAATSTLQAAIAAARTAAALEAPRRFWFVTAGVHVIAKSDCADGLAGSPLWGLRAVTDSEHPVLTCSAADLSSVPSQQDWRLLADELVAAGPEQEIAIRFGQRYVRRLRRGLTPVAADTFAAADGKPYRIVTTSSGVFEALSAEEMRRRAPDAGEVEIEVAFTGLNFMNVMSALGVCPGAPAGVAALGIECAGTVVRTGEGVNTFRPGDAVMAFAPDSLATHVVVDTRLVVAIPADLTPMEAATIPVAFSTALYALRHCGRLGSGERVLIHSAAGGVGLAAIQVARHAGATVFATAGSPLKRAWLRELGIEHVFDSHSLDFVRGVTEATNGEGVDVVLNSLAGEAIPGGLSLLREGGRFVEIGKRDIYEHRSVDLFQFRKNLSYMAIDLDRLSREQPVILGRLLAEVAHLVDAGMFTPLPVRRYAASQVQDAFRLMASGAHTGKIVIAHDARNTPIRQSVAAPASRWGIGTYLITGGTGDLGLEVARFLARRGARSLALMGRRSENRRARDIIARLRDDGVNVSVMQGDVASYEDVTRVLAEIDARHAPLAGIVHAAGVLEDSTLDRLDVERIDRVIAPKITGAWNLHKATEGRTLDRFVMFSSVAAFLGLGGQAHYAAGNAFLDGLATYRRARGLPGQSISWGPWASVGLAAADTRRGARLAEMGLGSLSPAAALAAFSEMLTLDEVHAIVMRFDVDQWCASAPHAKVAPLLGALPRRDRSPAQPESDSLRDALERLPQGRPRVLLLQEHLCRTVAKVLKLAPSRVDVTRPLKTLGLDSLMALELRNRLERDASVSLPATIAFNYPSVVLMAGFIAERMGLDLADSPEAPPGEEDVRVSALLAEIESITDEDARAMLGGPDVGAER